MVCYISANDVDHTPYDIFMIREKLISIPPSPPFINSAISVCQSKTANDVVSWGYLYIIWTRLCLVYQVQNETTDEIRMSCCFGWKNACCDHYLMELTLSELIECDAPPCDIFFASRVFVCSTHTPRLMCV